MKKSSVETMIRAVYKGEQIHNNPILGEELSQDDIKFMKMMQQSCQKVSGHYVLSLSFRNDNVALPNNNKLAFYKE